MATAKLPTVDASAQALVDLAADTGTVTQLRYTLRRVRLADGAYHQLTRPVEVKVLWDPEVEYWTAVDNKTTFAGAGDEPHFALQEYLDDWAERFTRLTEDEPRLGKPLAKELRSLRGLMGISRPSAT